MNFIQSLLQNDRCQVLPLEIPRNSKRDIDKVLEESAHSIRQMMPAAVTVPEPCLSSQGLILFTLLDILTTIICISFLLTEYII